MLWHISQLTGMPAQNQIYCSFAYQGMTAGVCWSAQYSGPTTAILCVSFEEGDE